MALPEVWDRFDRFTLRFVDRELERAYQHADQAEGVRRVRTTSLVAAVVWVVVAIIGPPAIGVAPASAWAICGTMSVFLLATAGASRCATTQRRRDAFGLGQQFVAGCGVLVLCVATGTVATYAMPGLMITAVFGFAVTRHPFVGSIAIGTAYCLLFLGVAEGRSLGSQLVLQLFLVAATVVAGCVGAYLLERSQRTAYAQGRLVRALHERVDLLGLVSAAAQPSLAISGLRTSATSRRSATRRTSPLGFKRMRRRGAWSSERARMSSSGTSPTSDPWARPR
jgi:hypothetical protein